MSEDRPVTLDFIAAQLQRVLSEIRILRDDMDVLGAIVRRLDNNQALMLDELRAMHAQQQRTAARGPRPRREVDMIVADHRPPSLYGKPLP